MSPLIDVTNTVGQDSSPDNPYTNSLRKSRVRISRIFHRVSGVHCQGEADITKSGKDVKVKSEAVAIAMCNTQVSGLVGNMSSIRGFSTIAHLCQCAASPVRVPPLPQTTDVLLSHAVQALSLSSLRTQTQPLTQRHFIRHSKGSRDHNGGSSSRKKFVSNCSGLPENSGSNVTESASQQCGACGLKFTSLSILTQHLARHVYDGLYAAQWLTQAMGLVFPRHSTVESNPIDQVDHDVDAALTGFLSNHPTPSGH